MRLGVSTLPALEYYVYHATVSAALAVHQYGKSCLKFSPYSKALEPCTRSREYIVTVFIPVYSIERRLVTRGVAPVHVRRYAI